MTLNEIVAGTMSTSEDGEYLTVAKTTDLGEDAHKLISIGGRKVLLCRSENQYFAVQNTCTHDMEPLTGGAIRKCTIVCPMHGARFSLKSGQPFGPPAFEPLDTYEVRIEGELIQVWSKPKT